MFESKIQKWFYPPLYCDISETVTTTPKRSKGFGYSTLKNKGSLDYLDC